MRLKSWPLFSTVADRGDEPNILGRSNFLINLKLAKAPTFQARSGTPKTPSFAVKITSWKFGVGRCSPNGSEPDLLAPVVISSCRPPPASFYSR